MTILLIDNHQRFNKSIRNQTHPQEMVLQNSYMWWGIEMSTVEWNCYLQSSNISTLDNVTSLICEPNSVSRRIFASTVDPQLIRWVLNYSTYAKWWSASDTVIPAKSSTITDRAKSTHQTIWTLHGRRPESESIISGQQRRQSTSATIPPSWPISSISHLIHGSLLDPLPWSRSNNYTLRSNNFCRIVLYASKSKLCLKNNIISYAAALKHIFILLISPKSGQKHHFFLLFAPVVFSPW